MGATECPKHGWQGINFVSLRLARQVWGKELASVEPILLLSLSWCGLWWNCPAHVDFFVENSLNRPSSGMLVIEDEEKSEQLMEKMRPVCGACLREFLCGNASPNIYEMYLARLRANANKMKPLE